MQEQETWFEFGEKFEQQRILGLLDIFENSLLDSEEDAKLTLHIVRKLITTDVR